MLIEVVQEHGVRVNLYVKVSFDYLYQLKLRAYAMIIKSRQNLYRAEVIAI